MFCNYFNRFTNCIRQRWLDFVSSLKCNSSCCNQVNIYNPKTCCVQTGEIFNRWVRATTPGTESPQFKGGETTCFTPKNK